MTTSDKTSGKRERDNRSAGGPSSRPADRGVAKGKKPDQLDPNEEDARNRQEALIDESVEESFPASDPPTPKRIT